MIFWIFIIILCAKCSEQKMWQFFLVRSFFFVWHSVGFSFENVYQAFDEKRRSYLRNLPKIPTWNSKQPVFYGCFNWMIQNLYMGNGCFTKHPFINGCLEFQELLRVILVISLPISPSKTCQAKRLTRLQCYCPSDPVIAKKKSDVLTFDTNQNAVLIVFHETLSTRQNVHVYWVLLDNLSVAPARGYLAFSFFQLWVVLGSFSPCRSVLPNPICKWIYGYEIHISNTQSKFLLSEIDCKVLKCRTRCHTVFYESMTINKHNNIWKKTLPVNSIQDPYHSISIPTPFGSTEVQKKDFTFWWNKILTVFHRPQPSWEAPE